MASGNSLIQFEPSDNRPPLAGGAVPDVRNTQLVLRFGASGGAVAQFTGVLPRHYSGLGITATLMWTAESAVSGQVQWSLAFERHDPATDLDVDSFAAAVNAALATCNATNGGPIYTEVAITNAQLDGLLAGEHFRLKVTRLAGGGMTGDAQLWSLELRET